MRLDLLVDLDLDVVEDRLSGRPAGGPGVARVRRRDGRWLEVVSSTNVVDTVRVVPDLQGEGLVLDDGPPQLWTPGADPIELAPYNVAAGLSSTRPLPQRCSIAGQVVLLDAPLGDLVATLRVVEGEIAHLSVAEGGWERRRRDLTVIATTYLRMIAWHRGSIEYPEVAVAVQGRWFDLLALVGVLGLGPFRDSWRGRVPGPSTCRVLSALGTVS